MAAGVPRLVEAASSRVKLAVRQGVRQALRQAVWGLVIGLVAMTGVTLLSAAGLIVLIDRYGALPALLSVGGGMIALAIALLLVMRLRAVRARRAALALAAVQAAPAAPAPAAPAAVPESALASPLSLDGLDAARARWASRLPEGLEARITEAARDQIARRPVRTVAAAAAVGLVIGFVRTGATRRPPRV